MSEYEVGEIPPEQLEKQKRRYELKDFVKGRVDEETLGRIAHKADELQKALTEEDKEAIANDWNLTGEDIRIAEKAAELIARDYGKILKKLEDE